MIPVLAPGGDAFQSKLLELLGAIAEVYKDFPIICSKASDHKHDLKRFAHGVPCETQFVDEETSRCS